MKRKLTYTSILVILIACLVAQKTLPFTFKLQAGYEASLIDVKSRIDEFSRALLEKGILEEEDLKRPQSIYSKLEVLIDSVHPNEFGIQSYVIATPLKLLKKDKLILDADIQDQSNIALFTYYQLLSEKHLEIPIRIHEDRTLSFNGEHLPMASFESVLFETINGKSDQNVSADNAIIVIEAEPYTDSDFVFFIQEKLREIGLRKIKYKSVKD